jgi:MYND finger
VLADRLAQKLTAYAFVTVLSLTMIHACDRCLKKSSPGEKFPRCSSCKISRYCGEACQKAHWPAHKKQCPGFAKLRAEDRFVGKINDLVQGKFGMVGSLAMILVGTDPADYADRCAVFHVRLEDGRAKVLAAHVGPRSRDHGNDGTWKDRDEKAAKDPRSIAMVIEFLRVTESGVKLYSELIHDLPVDDYMSKVAEMREDPDVYVQLYIDLLNA